MAECNTSLIQKSPKRPKPFGGVFLVVYLPAYLQAKKLAIRLGRLANPLPLRRRLFFFFAFVLAFVLVGVQSLHCTAKSPALPISARLLASL
jgi:hypothetical protein